MIRRMLLAVTVAAAAAACDRDPSGPVTIAGLTVVVTPASDTVVVGGLTLQLLVTITDSAGAVVTTSVQWASRNPATASVDPAGIVTGTGSGTVWIVATAGGAADSAAIRALTPAEVPPALLLIAGGVSLPVLATSPRHDSSRVFVVLQDGVIRVIRNDTLRATPFLNLTGLISIGGERGLLGLAFHPQYAANGRFYLNFTNLAGDTRVVRYQVSANPDIATPAAAETVLAVAQPFANHNGGLLAFGPDGYLYIGMGDGGSGGDPQNHGQTMSSLLGKVLRIDVNGASSYTIPPTNPFVGQAGARAEIWATGLRNPWRWSFDRLTGDLYIGDVGQGAREELDVQAAGSPGGQNYGWRLMEGSICFVAGCSSIGLTLPVLDYTHAEGCSVTGGYVYRGGAVPMLAGHYLYADYCSGWVRSFRWAGNAATTLRDWTSSLAPGGNISSFGEDARGEVYLLEHAANGSVFRIVPSIR